jgi:hypothetical protein
VLDTALADEADEEDEEPLCTGEDPVFVADPVADDAEAEAEADWDTSATNEVADGVPVVVLEGL